MSRSSDKSDLAELFPIPCECIQTRGTGDGIILKFRTFYLKIYDSDNEVCSYVVKGYLYNKQNPVFVDVVPDSKMRRYASQFTTDNYLEEFMHQRRCYVSNIT